MYVIGDSFDINLVSQQHGNYVMNASDIGRVVVDNAQCSTRITHE